MKNALSYLRPVAAIGSIALFVYLVQRTGPELVLQNIRALGWGVAAVILLSGMRQVLRAVAWSYCIDNNLCRPAALQLLGARLMGEALNDLTPAGPLLGEPAKVVVVSRLIPGETAASSVLLENLIYVLGAVLFMLSGVAVAVVSVASLRGFWWIGFSLAACVLTVVAMVFLTLSRRCLLLGTLLDSLRRWGCPWAFLERHEQSIRAVERSIHKFFVKRPRTFLAVLAIEAATNLTGVVEAYLILNGTAAHASLLAAFLVESASRAVQFMFSFVPLGLGVQEGAAAATLRAVGYAAGEGVSLSLIRKIRSLFWAAVGLFFAARYSMALPEAERSTS